MIEKEGRIIDQGPGQVLSCRQSVFGALLRRHGHILPKLHQLGVFLNWQLCPGQIRFQRLVLGIRSQRQAFPENSIRQGVMMRCRQAFV